MTTDRQPTSEEILAAVRAKEKEIADARAQKSATEGNVHTGWFSPLFNRAAQFAERYKPALRAAWNTVAWPAKHWVWPVIKYPVKAYAWAFNKVAFKHDKETGEKIGIRKLGFAAGILPALALGLDLLTGANGTKLVGESAWDSLLTLTTSKTENVVLLGPDRNFENHAQFFISASHVYPGSPADAFHFEAKRSLCLWDWVSTADAEQMYDVTPPETSFATARYVGFRLNLFGGLINIYPTLRGISEIRSFNQLADKDPLKKAYLAGREIYAHDYPLLEINKKHLENAPSVPKNDIAVPRLQQP